MPAAACSIVVKYVLPVNCQMEEISLPSGAKNATCGQFRSA